jgi:hypothetical protein
MYTNIAQIFDDPLWEYVSVDNSAEEFIEGMCLLSFLLTADRETAETCFSSALQDYLEAQGGFMDWAKQEGRQAVIRNAVQMMRPAPKPGFGWPFHTTARPLVSAAYQPFTAITSLSTFERFVFVLSALEGFSEEECAALLQCTFQEVARGREVAERVFAAEDRDSDMTSEWICFAYRTSGAANGAVC